jgi:L-lactate dehydrogenase complex protein LldF
MSGPPVQQTSPTFVGMPSFPEAAREALANTQQRDNLRNATHTIRAKRAAVVAEVPEWEALRVAGADAKDEALTHLGDYLELLEASLTANGATVHWARDADEANAIVVEIARAKGVDEVVKVKSMATQEIELNEALEAAGIAAWETDLAELIVQLFGDRPSHILVPAIHRNRTEIRDVFLREMAKVGRPAPEDLTDEPARLAEAARLHLREKFLRARVAVSGANFAIADTGTLVVVESEGNAARDAQLGRRHREGPADVGRPRADAPAAPALEHGGADEPLHDHVVGSARRRRTAGGPRRAARQRAQPRARRHRGPAGAAVHPVLGLPQRLPRL